MSGTRGSLARLSASVVGPHLRLFIAGCLLAVMGLELLARLSGSAVIQVAAHAAVFLTVLASVKRLGFREAYLLSLCAGLSALAYMLHPRPGEVMNAALDQAAFLMAFILLLNLLYEAASTSPAVAECGTYLTQQAPGRRYYALYLGTGAMAVLFNLGIVSFLVPLIRRGIEAAPEDA